MSRRSKRSMKGAPPPSARMGAGSSGPPTRPEGGLIKQPTTSRLLVQKLAIEADVARVIGIFDRADAGQTWDMHDLYDDGLLRDSRLEAVARKRLQSITATPYVIEPMDALRQDAEAKRIASNVATILAESPQFESAILRLADGILKGLGVCEIDWRIDARGWYVPRLIWRHQNLFGYTPDLQLGFRLGLGSTQVCPLADYPDQTIVHVPLGGRSTYPARLGALRTRILPSLVKRSGIRWWAILLERWGQPQVYARQQDGDNNDTAINDAFKSLSEYWQAVFPQGCDIETIPMSGQVSSEAHARFVELANTDDAIAILGQNLTTEVQGGSFAATVAHSEVADVIRRADLTELAETISQQLIEPIVRYNWPGAPVPRFRFVAERAQAITVEAVRDGVFSEDEMRRSAGHEPKADGSGSLYRTPQEQQPAVSITTPGASAPAAATVQDTALNGAQSQALLTIGQLVKQGAITIDFAIFSIIKSFPTISEDEARAALSSTTVTPAPETPPGGAGTEPPFPPTDRATSLPSRTSARSTHPLASALSRRSGG